MMILSRAWNVLLLTGTLFHLYYGLQLNPSMTVVEKLVGSDFDIMCSGKVIKEINWYDNRGDLVNLRPGNVVAHKRDKPDEIILTFNNITMSNGGNYTCHGKQNDQDVNVQFELSVVQPIRFKTQQTVFYHEEGQAVQLPCELTADARTYVLWEFNNQAIEGDRYKMVDEHTLVIKNITHQDFGNYVCKAVLNTDQLSEAQKLIFTVKQAKKPIIETVKGDNVYGLLNNSIEVECEAYAEPPAEINWNRNGEKVHLDVGTEVIQRANASILKISSLKTHHFGEYVCVAKNLFGVDEKPFHLHEALPPAPPRVKIREIFSDSIQLDITSIRDSWTDMYYRFNYTKDDQNSTASDSERWNFIDLDFKSSQTEPYSINQLEPSTKYIYQVASCSKYVCSFTPMDTFTTENKYTSSANNLYVPYIDILIIPTLFTISFICNNNIFGISAY